MTTATIPQRCTLKGLGTAGEQFARLVLSTGETIVTDTANDRDKKGDLRVLNTTTGEVVRIEVKTARRDSQNKYQACLHRQVKSRVCTDAQHSNFVLMLCAVSDGSFPVMFLIPTEAIVGMKTLAITGSPYSYTGKWSKFRVRPETIMKHIFS